MDVQSLHNTTITDRTVWQEELQGLIKLSTTEFRNCISDREFQGHGPDDFYQVVYSAFSICLDWDCSRMIVNVAYFAQTLTKQTEVREFIAKNIDPVWLQSTVTLASHLLNRVSDIPLEKRDMFMQGLQRERTSVFLEVWEKFVYPVLKEPGNIHWAEKWRGGHITNYAG